MERKVKLALIGVTSLGLGVGGYRAYEALDQALKRVEYYQTSKQPVPEEPIDRPEWSRPTDWTRKITR